MIQSEEKFQAENTLYRLFPPNHIVSTMVVKVSSSGMSRHIVFFAVGADNVVQNVSHLVALALGWKYSANSSAVVVSGAGMDMAYHAVYTLARSLYGNGYALAHASV